MNKEKLLQRKEILEKKLKAADETNNFMMCMMLGNSLNVIDEKLRNLQEGEDQ